MGLAGAEPGTLHLWLDDWSATPTAPEGLPVRLRAAEGEVAIDFQLARGKPPVPQGDRGLSRKGAEPGNPSYYYSLTRMPTEGVVTVGRERFTVSGLSWMDWEWSTSALGPDQIGWDWYALQLSNGQELMFYRLRRRDGSTYSAQRRDHRAPRRDARGARGREVVIDTLSTWGSPRGGYRYPARTRLRVPKADLELEVTPRLPEQELEVLGSLRGGGRRGARHGARGARRAAAPGRLGTRVRRGVRVGRSLGSVIVYDVLNRLVNEDEAIGCSLKVVARTPLLLTFGSPLDRTAFLFAVQRQNTGEGPRGTRRRGAAAHPGLLFPAKVLDQHLLSLGHHQRLPRLLRSAREQRPQARPEQKGSRRDDPAGRSR